MFTNVRFLIVLVALALPASGQMPTATPAKQAQSSAIHNVFWQPNELHQGSPMFLTVELERPAVHVSGNFVNKSLSFFAASTDKKTWYALAGVDVEAAPGNYGLDVSATFAGGHIAHSSQQITVSAGDFKTGDINVPENYVNPSEAEQKQIVQDEVLKRRAYAHTASRPLWSGDFARPVKGESTSSFGESRILNEEKTSLHTGTDFPVPEGTTVSVANAGTVVLVRDLFYEGNTVIVDHGLGVFTVYLHMSRIDVHEGQRLNKGEKLGLSGASGRVTGPHVHLGVRWNGCWLDPMQLVGLTLPKNTAETVQHHVVPRAGHP